MTTCQPTLQLLVTATGDSSGNGSFL